MLTDTVSYSAVVPTLTDGWAKWNITIRDAAKSIVKLMGISGIYPEFYLTDKEYYIYSHTRKRRVRKKYENRAKRRMGAL